jgi:hypothetical protein
VRKLKVKIIYDSIFKFGWLLSVGGTEEQITTFLQKKHGFYPSNILTAAGFFSWNSGNGKQCAIWTKEGDDVTILHEVIHATNFVAKYLNLKIDVHNEFVTYYGEYLFENLKSLNKDKK